MNGSAGRDGFRSRNGEVNDVPNCIRAGCNGIFDIYLVPVLAVFTPVVRPARFGKGSSARAEHKAKLAAEGILNRRTDENGFSLRKTVHTDTAVNASVGIVTGRRLGVRRANEFQRTALVAALKHHSGRKYAFVTCYNGIRQFAGLRGVYLESFDDRETVTLRLRHLTGLLRNCNILRESGRRRNGNSHDGVPLFGLGVFVYRYFNFLIALARSGTKARPCDCLTVCVGHCNVPVAIRCDRERFFRSAGGNVNLLLVYRERGRVGIVCAVGLFLWPAGNCCKHKKCD